MKNKDEGNKRKTRPELAESLVCQKRSVFVGVFLSLNLSFVFISAPIEQTRLQHFCPRLLHFAVFVQGFFKNLPLCFLHDLVCQEQNVVRVCVC